MAIVDPPYGIGQDGSNNYSRGKLALAKNYKSYSGEDKEPPSHHYFQELFRISKNQIIWGANHFIELFNKNSSCWIVWDKDNGKTDFSDCELAWTSFDTAVRKFKYRWNGMFQGELVNGRDNHLKEIRIHGNQKPIALYKWLLLNYAKQGDKIFDSHLGSGSSRIAAWELGFDFVGCELDKYYFEESIKRYENHIAQQRLFELNQYIRNNIYSEKV